MTEEKQRCPKCETQNAPIAEYVGKLYYSCSWCCYEWSEDIMALHKAIVRIK